MSEVDLDSPRAPIVYLAHAISIPLKAGGRVWDDHKDSVHEDAKRLAWAGMVPIVPQDLDPTMPWKEALRLDRSLIEACDGIFVHTSDFPSSGVALEITWGNELGKVVSDDIQELRDALYS